MVAERTEVMDKGISFIPRSGELVEAFLKPRMKLKLVPAPAESRSTELVSVDTEFPLIQSTLATNAGSIPDRFADLLKLSDPDVSWVERKRETPTKRDIAVYLGFDSQNSQGITSIFPGGNLIHPTESAVSSIISEQGIDTTRAGDNSVPVIIRTAGLITHKHNVKSVVKYDFNIEEALIVTRDLDGNPTDNIETHNVGIEKPLTDAVKDQRIVAVTFDRGSNFHATSGLVSLSFLEFNEAQKRMMEYGVGPEFFDMIALLPNHEVPQSPGFITKEMVTRSQDSVGVYFHKAEDGNIYFGSEKLSLESLSFTKIQAACHAMGLKIKQQKGSEHFSISFTPPQDNSTDLYRWGIPIPHKLSL